MQESVPGPIFSVLVPCYMRGKDLANTLQRIGQQSHSRYETVVIDDCSPDDSVKNVAYSFEGVRYVRSDRNRGVIGARNYGVQHCRGKYIVNLDDDSWLVNDDALVKLESLFLSDPSIGIVAFNVASREENYRWNPDSGTFQCATYSGCGNAYSRAARELVGPYIEQFGRQGEELEHSLRFIDNGYNIMAAPHILIYHNESPINRNRRKIEAYEAINNIRRELALAPGIVLPFSLGRALVHLITRIHKIDWRLAWEEAVGEGKSLAQFAIGFRRPVKLSSYTKWMKLRWLTRRRYLAA